MVYGREIIQGGILTTGSNGYGEVTLPISITDKVVVLATPTTSSSSVIRTASYVTIANPKVKFMTHVDGSLVSCGCFYLCFGR